MVVRTVGSVYRNLHFTLKQNPLTRTHVDGFVAAYAPGRQRDERVETERFRSVGYDELIAREIVEDLTAALEEFSAVAAALEPQPARETDE